MYHQVSDPRGVARNDPRPLGMEGEQQPQKAPRRDDRRPGLPSRHAAQQQSRSSDKPRPRQHHGDIEQAIR